MRPLLLVLLFALSGALSAAPSSHLDGNDPHSKQRKRFPKELKKIYFGMPMEEFKKKMKNKVTFDGNLMSFRTEGVQTAPSKRIKEITYYFDDQPGNPLYEVIIDYKDTAVRDSDAKTLLGELSGSSEWVFDTGEGFNTRAWTFASKLVYAAQMEGTEWDPKK